MGFAADKKYAWLVARFFLENNLSFLLLIQYQLTGYVFSSKQFLIMLISLVINYFLLIKITVFFLNKYNNKPMYKCEISYTWSMISVRFYTYLSLPRVPCHVASRLASNVFDKLFIASCSQLLVTHAKLQRLMLRIVITNICPSCFVIVDCCYTGA